MKRMLRWRLTRYVAWLLVFATSSQLGIGAFRGSLVSGAAASPGRAQVVVFPFVNKSKQGGDLLAGDFTKQLRLAIEQSPKYGLVAYSTQAPYSPPIERALREERLRAEDLTVMPDPDDPAAVAAAVKIAQIMGAENILVGQIDEDGYVLEREQKRVTLKVTAYLFRAVGQDAAATPANIVTGQGVGTGETVGMMDERARVAAATQVADRLSDKGHGTASGGGKKKRFGMWPLVILGGAALVALIVSMGGSKKSTPSGPGPSSLSVSPTRDGVHLVWAPVSGATGYKVYRATVTNGVRQQSLSFALVANLPAGQVQYDDKPTAAAGYTYVYRVTAVTGGGEGSPIESLGLVAPGRPSLVTGLAASANLRTITVTWNANPEDFIAGYRVYRSNGDGVFTKISQSDILSGAPRVYADSGLAPETTYAYKVSAVGSNGLESDRDGMDPAFATTKVAPSPPRNVTATVPEGGKEITVSWDKSPEEDVTYYELHRSQAAASRAGRPGLPVRIWKKSSPKFGSRSSGYQLIATNLKPVGGASRVIYVDKNGISFDTTYTYVVIAVSGETRSPFAESVPVPVTPNKKPAQVQGVNVAAGDTEVTVRWNVLPEADIAGYDVYRQQVDDPEKVKTKATDTPTEALQFVDKNVVNDTAYLYFVRAIDGSGLEGPFSQPAGPVTPSTPPAKPAGLRASAGKNVVFLMWTANNEANLKGYRVYRSDTVDGPQSRITPDQDLDKSIVVYSDTTVYPGSTYYYFITAVNKNGVESPKSDPVSASPAVPPAAPANVQAVGAERSVTVTWSPVTTLADGTDLAAAEVSFRGYRIYRTDFTSRVTTMVKDLRLSELGGVTRYVDTGVVQDGSYQYTVTAVAAWDDGILESQPILPISPLDPPKVWVGRRTQAPTNFVGTPGDGSVTFTWDASSDLAVKGYTIYAATQATGPFNPVRSVSTQPTVNDPGTTRYVLTSVDGVPLVNDRRYWFRIAAVDSASEGLQSDPAIMVIPNVVPPAPTNLTATNLDGTAKPMNLTVDLAWTRVPTAVDGYRVYLAVGDEAAQKVADLPPTASTYRHQFPDGLLVPSLVVGADLNYTVRAFTTFTTAGEVLSAAATLATVHDPAPTQVQGVQISSEGGSVTLTWAPLTDPLGARVRDITNYWVYRVIKDDTSGAQERFTVRYTGPGCEVYTDSEVTVGTTYQYWVTAHDYTNEGPDSEIKEITP